MKHVFFVTQCPTPSIARTISADLRLAAPMNARASGHRCHLATAFLKGDDSASAPPRFNGVFLRAEGSQENGVNSRISKIIPRSMCVFLYFCAVPFRDYMIYIYLNIYQQMPRNWDYDLVKGTNSLWCPLQLCL